jgi:hypothetical protein
MFLAEKLPRLSVAFNHLVTEVEEEVPLRPLFSNPARNGILA